VIDARKVRFERDRAIAAAKAGIEAAISALILAKPDMEPLGANKINALQDRLIEAQKGKAALADF
jgi:hypothetical protein